VLLSHKKIAFFDTHIIASPVEFVPKFNCSDINFCRHTNPNIALKIMFDGCEKMGIFWLEKYDFPCKICVRLTTISLGFVPECNCCGINFCRQTNPNLALKF
jgi:hypothetical protein